MNKYDKLISEMTLDEKISMLSGANFWNTQDIERLGIKSIMLTDGPHGLRKQGGASDHLGLNESIPATCFPTAATIANSFNKELIFEMGQYLGHEAMKEDVSVLLGPGLNIKRNPLCGRNFEYFSEDPYLTGVLASELVKGIESTGVSSCPKHFAVNSQEKLRMTIDEIVDERALRETYLKAFEEVISHKPKTIMTSYNKVNGIYANEHPYLIKDILQDEWGYEGIIVTDWGGNNDRVEALKVGNQLEMPSSGGITDREVKQAIEDKTLDESFIDKAVEDLLKYVDIAHVSMNKNSSTSKDFYDVDKFHKKAMEVALDSIVLLENDGILPLLKENKISVIGDFAYDPRYQGAGSSLIKPTMITSPLTALKEDGFNIVSDARGYKRYGKKSTKLLKEAVSKAKESDYVLYFMGLDESSETEGLDRLDMKVKQAQIDTLKEIYKVNQNVIIIISGGSSIETDFTKYSRAVINTYLSGQAMGDAISKIISGEINPSGKLAETYSHSHSDHLSSKYYPGNEATAEHRESIFIGYRYFETVNKEVKYPFGHGLSYSSFEYSNLKVNRDYIKVDITNTSDIDGKEVVQVYMEPINSKIFRSSIELIGFDKVFIKAHETITIKVKFDKKAFNYYNTQHNTWDIETLDYKVSVGGSIKDLKLNDIINIKSDNNFILNEENKEYVELTDSISLKAFEKLCDRKLPSTNWDRTKKLTLNDTIAQASYQGILGKGIYKLLIGLNKFLMKLNKPIIANYIFFVVYMPWRQVSRFTNEKIKEKTVEKLLKKL